MKTAQPDSGLPNLWIPCTSPLMPLPLPNWAFALKQLSSLSTALDPRPITGLDGGYVVPDPNMIARASNPRTQAIYIHGWVQVRELFLYRLRYVESAKPLSNRIWKSVLGMDKRSNKVTPHPNSRRTKEVDRAQEDLELVLRKARSKISVADLRLQTAHWGDNPVVLIAETELPDESIVREILWELAEVNFRHDFLNIDYLETLGREGMQRRMHVEELCWPDHSSYPDRNNIHVSIASQNPQERFRRLFNFFIVVQDWRCHKPPVFDQPFPLPTQSAALDDVEQAIALVYADRFYQYHYRPASIPYRI